ncbi:hypothetical protein BDB01DRAFT_851730 [Pilobolus umbonatus]|nr:hypothetical protein BDB01DRAFT_851730 [Pilobolus umbonatus]
MDPQAYTAVLFNRINSYHFNKNHQLLESIFGQVFTETDIDECIKRIKQLPTTLFLLELDNTIATNEHILLIRDISSKIPERVPLIVCSSHDDPVFMVECIQSGASDYLLLPLEINVLKTLFLTLHRQQPKYTPLFEDSLVPSDTVSSDNSIISPITPTASPHSIYLPDRIQDRIKELHIKDTNLTKIIVENLAPTSHTLCSSITRDKKMMLAKRVSTWNFNPLALSIEDLIHCAVIILTQALSLNDLHYLTQAQLYSFVTDLANIYNNNNPYHNFTHAVDVLQCTYYFLCQLGLLSLADGTLSNHASHHILNPRDIFALLIAAIGHDTAHPGVNNSFLHEFHHLLGGADSVEYKEFRKIVISTILSTDMALHGDYILKIDEQKQRLKKNNPGNVLEEKLLFCSGLIKCADISNVARPFSLAYQWSQVLIDEFTAQGDLERELGMDVQPMNDRNKIELEEFQIGFIQFVVSGLFKSISEYMQELSFTVDQIEMNLSIWQERKESAKLKTPDDNKMDSTATTVVEDKSVEDDYFKQAAKSLNSESDLKLPRMPDIAMTSLSSRTYPTQKNTQQDDLDEDNHWTAYQSSGPVYCQCLIQ